MNVDKVFPSSFSSSFIRSHLFEKTVNQQVLFMTCQIASSSEEAWNFPAESLQTLHVDGYCYFLHFCSTYRLGGLLVFSENIILYLKKKKQKNKIQTHKVIDRCRGEIVLKTDTTLQLVTAIQSTAPRFLSQLFAIWTYDRLG